MKKVLVLGYFGYVTNQLDGQTIKTQNVYRLLNNFMDTPDLVDYFDTQDLSFSKFSVFVLIRKLCKCERLVYLPAQKNLKYIFPFLYILSRIVRFEINYIVIGGWLTDYLKIKRIHRWMLSRIRGIFPENILTVKELYAAYGLKNVYHLPNFRFTSFIPEAPEIHHPFKIVFMSRIMRMKGIDVVFSIADYVNKHFGGGEFEIDFYGPVQKEDKDYFENSLKRVKGVKYKGELLPEEIHKTLSEYDLLVLPTRFYTEGFPGAVLDAYIAQVPVLVSSWKYAEEYVASGKTGFICDVNDYTTFCKIVVELYRDAEYLKELKKNALLKSKEYTPEKTWAVLKNFLI